MLTVYSNEQICRNIPILQLLKSRVGIAIEDQIEAVKSPALLQSAQELFHPLNHTVNFAVGDHFILKRDEMH